MIENLQNALSQAPSDRVIEFSDNTFLVDAALIGELLHVPATSVPILMRERRITSICERGTGQDEAEFRLTFFYRSRRARLITDAAGAPPPRTQGGRPARGPNARAGRFAAGAPLPGDER